MRKFTMKQVMNIGILSGLFFFTAPNMAQNIPVTTSDPLCMSLQATGAELSRAHIIGKAKITCGEDMSKSMIGEIGRALHIDTDKAVVEEQRGAYQSVSKLSYNDETRQVVISVSWRNEAKREKEVAIYSIQRNPLYADIMPLREIISEILQKFNPTPQITTCLEGYIDGKLRKGMREYCLADSFDAIQANQIKGIRNENYVSYIGYSGLLPQGVLVDKQEINVNIAMRYHAFDDRTYVVVGTPLITIDY